MAIKIKKISVAGQVVYPATILDAVKDAKSVKVEGVETNEDYGKTLRQILESLKASIKALSDLGLTAEDIAQIATNKAAIETLNGTSTEDGSVAKQVADAIADVVANAPEDFDTLKEIADWIANDDNKTAADIVAGVSANTAAIGEKAKAAEYYATYEEYVAAAEAEGWATEYTLKREFDDDAPDAGEKLKTGTGTAATGLYKEIADAKAEAIAAAKAAEHSKTTVVTGATNGTVAVDGTDVAVKGLGSAAYTEATAYDASGAADTAEQNAKDYADGLATNYDEAGAAAAVQGETTTTVKALEDKIGVASKAESAEGAGDAVTATGLMARIEAIESGSIEVTATSDTTEYADVF